MQKFKNIHVLGNETVVIGSPLVPPKLIFVMEQLAKINTLRGIDAIIFERNDPETFGRVDRITMTARINMEKHIRVAFDNAKRVVEYDGKVGYWLFNAWINLIDTIIHEAGHCLGQRFREFDDANETMLKVFINNVMVNLAQMSDVECPGPHEWGGMTEMVLAKIEELRRTDELWAKKQLELMMKGIAFEHQMCKIRIETTRQWIREMNPERAEEAAWGGPIGMYYMTDPIEDTQISASLGLMSEEEIPVPEEVRNVEWITQKVEEVHMPTSANNLAPPVNAFQPAYQNAMTVMAGAQTPQPVARKIVAPPVNLPMDQVQKLIATFYDKLAECIFNKCGWNPGAGGTGFTNPFNVYEGVFIGDLPGINQIILAYDMPYQKTDGTTGIQKDVNPWENPNPEYIGRIYGIVLEKSQLPAFRFYVNQGGEKHKRSFIPQNIADLTKTGKNVMRARAGDRIAYVYNDEVQKGGPIASWDNGVYRMWNK